MHRYVFLIFILKIYFNLNNYNFLQMKLEEEERKFLLLFLLDYKDVKLNTHFFHEKVNMS